MAELNTLARPYARAAFEYALNAQDLAGWNRQLSLLAAVSKIERVNGLISSPAVTGAQQVQCLLDVCGDELSAAGRNFVAVLASNKRLALLSQIAKLFEELKAAREQTVEVQISTAYDIDEQTQGQLAEALNRKLKRSTKINTVVDKSLLGGVLIRAGDIVIDASVRGRLAKLAESMNL